MPDDRVSRSNSNHHSATTNSERAISGAGLSLEIDDKGIAILEFDQPESEHNRLTAELLRRWVRLMGDVRAAARAGDVVGVVVSSAKSTSFIAGMDVGSIAAVKTASEGRAGAREGQRAFQLLADLPVPSVAAINGTCLGGGTELALACTYRVASDASAVEIGLPEVTLGIIPGFGGTQRLPRLMSIERALTTILTGRSLDARRALRYGLVDAVVPAPLLHREARRLLDEHGPGRASSKTRASGPGPSKRRGRRRPPEDRALPARLRRWALEGNLIGRAFLFWQATRRTAKQAAGHYPAPPMAIDAVRTGLRGSLENGLRHEAELLGQLVVSDVARNLVGLFFLRQASRRTGRVERSAGGAREDAPNVTATAAARPARQPQPGVRQLGVIGAGVMGGGIAQLGAYQGLPVRLKDIARAPLATAMRVAHRRFEERRRSGKLSPAEAATRMQLISPTVEYSGFRRADLVIEAVVEDLRIKRAVLADVEAAAGPDTVLATNTSSLTLSAMSDALRDPGRLVGLHFFNPVHKMPLVEVVRGEHSSSEAIATTVAFAVAMGKVPIIVADAPGFFVNRVLAPYFNEALLLLEEGVPIATIDAALRDFGMPMGPLRLLDEVGLDVAGKASMVMEEAFGDRMQRAPALGRLIDLELVGRKGGRGFYVYSDKRKHEPKPDPEIERLFTGSRGGAGRGGHGANGARSRERDVIVDRCVLVMLAEATRALEEGIVAGPLEADLAMVFGTGFAPFRGGLFRYAEARGLQEVCDRLADLVDKTSGNPARFAVPAQLRTWVASAAGAGRIYPDPWPQRATMGL